MKRFAVANSVSFLAFCLKGRIEYCVKAFFLPVFDKFVMFFDQIKVGMLSMILKQ